MTNPSDLVIPLSATASNIENYLLDTTYTSLMISSHPSNCPIIEFELQDNSGTLLSDANINLVNPQNVATAQMNIENDAAFTVTIRIEASLGTVKNFITLNIEVCGAETLVAAAKQSLAFGFEAGSPPSLADGVRYHTIPEATFGPYFTLTSVSGACPVNAYSINTDASGTPWTDAVVTLPGSIGSYDLKIDKTVVSSATQSVFLRAGTDGLVTADHEIEFVVCPVTTGGNTITPSAASYSADL